MTKVPFVALVGRTNVGKSTLFNSLLGFKRSLVDTLDGLTRDCLVEPLELEGRQLLLVDTGGLDRLEDNPLDRAFLKHTWAFLQHVDQFLFVLDAAVGLCPTDLKLIARFQAEKKKIVFLWNKADLAHSPKVFDEVRQVTKDPYWMVSSSDPESIWPIKTLLSTFAASAIEQADPQLEQTFGFFGRPNVGKSSLANAVVRSEQCLVSEQPGTTRDFSKVVFKHNDALLRLIDTAGVLAHAHRHPEVLERMTYYRTLVALKQVSVGILVLDSVAGLTAQDLKILSLLAQYRRGLVIALNKWDCLDQAERKDFMEKIQYQLKAFAFCPIVPVSAQRKSNLKALLEAVLAVMDSFSKVISTGQVNKILEEMLEQHQPPIAGRYRIKLRYAHVVDTHPLTIMIHGTQLDKLPGHYKRYLINSFCKSFNLVGIPLKLEFKNSTNPYNPSSTN